MGSQLELQIKTLTEYQYQMTSSESVITSEAFIDMGGVV